MRLCNENFERARLPSTTLAVRNRRAHRRRLHLHKFGHGLLIGRRGRYRCARFECFEVRRTKGVGWRLVSRF